MFYDENTVSIVMDAVELCELACKSGDIDSRFSSRANELVQENIPHTVINKLYREYGAYSAYDMALSLTQKHKELYYTVNVTADALTKQSTMCRVDMIRLVRKYDFYAPPKQIWLSYLKLSGLAVAQKYQLDRIKLRIYFVLSEKDDEKIKYFDYSYTVSELQGHFSTLIEKISFRAENEYNKKVLALPSASAGYFPYENLREGQEIMVKECYSAIKRGKRLFLQAPTGTGKTIAALYPSAKALGNGLADKIFYLTSKASTRKEAFRGAAKLFEAGIKLRTVVIGAKEQVCVCPGRITGRSCSSLCNPYDCSYAKDYYSKVEGALEELLKSGRGYTLRCIAEVAKKHQVCPYELSLDLSEFCDIIICDYNYAFDPSVYFRRYFSSDRADNSKYVFLVDEAHNLVDRARDMYSASFESDKLSALISLLSPEEKELKNRIEKLWQVMNGLKDLCADTMQKDSEDIVHGFYVSNNLIEQFVNELEAFKKKCETWLKSNRAHELWSMVNDLVAYAKKYLCVAEYFDKRFYNCIYLDGSLIRIRIFCLDPSYILDKLMMRARSTVLFSATMTPLDYFSQMLGGDKDTQKISLPSAFDPENICVVAAGYINTRFNDRGENVSKYLSLIAAAVSRRAGNYIAYFPSYDCLWRVYSAFVKKYPDVDTVIQKKNMTFSEKEEFLDFFKNDSGVLRIGFCVLGGSFSEGVDLPGARLIGAIIFGVGLPGLSSENNIIRDYYDNRGECGFDYAYTIPGMNNVLQAAGRVIRQEEDSGVIVLADDRYLEPRYTELFPAHWNSVKKANNASEVAGIIQNFWLNCEN